MHDIEAVGCRRLGVIANPFTAPWDDSADPLGVKLSKAAASNALIGALHRQLGHADTPAIVVEKDEDIPAPYYVEALAGALRRLAAGEVAEGLYLYVPLDMMRIGRVRAVLNMLAERVAGTSVDVTIARWAHGELSGLDRDSDQWRALASAGDVETLIDQAAAEPEAFTARVFGALAASRDGADDLEMLGRVSDARQRRLDTDPDIAEDEIDADDPMGAAFTTPLGDIDERVLVAGSADDLRDAVAALLMARAAELSPVIARGLEAYRAQGAASMAEELKISKAPSKTLVALARFARYRFGQIAVFFDRFDLFQIAPQQLQDEIASALFQMRLSLRGLATFVLILEPGIAPQVDEAFGTAARVDWRFSALRTVGDADADFDLSIARDWLAGSSLSDETPAWAGDLLAAVPAGARATDALTALGVAIDTALAENRVPVSADVATAFEAARS